MAESITTLNSNLASVVTTLKTYQSAIKEHLLNGADTPILLDLANQFDITDIITKINREAYTGGDMDRGVLVDVVHQVDALYREIYMRAFSKPDYYSQAIVELGNNNNSLDIQTAIFNNNIRGSN